ncbi:MAG: M48 family metalloprotease [Rickettsiales bacterium]
MIKPFRHVISALCAICLSAQPAYALPLIRDAEIEYTLRNYGDPLFKAAGLKPSAVKIFIVNGSSLNAFVAGGSNLFLNTGLIMATKDASMLIGVMAHETAHIAGGHLARGGEKLKDAQLGTIMSMVLGAAAAAATRKPEAAAAVMTGTQSSLMRNFLAYTRTQEEAADQAALTYLDKTNTSASGLLDTFALLQRNERMHISAPDPYLRSHPLSSSRIEHVRNHVQQSNIPEGKYPSRYKAMHDRMVAKLYGFMETPERTMRKYPLASKDAASRMARAIAYYKMPDTDRALIEMDSLIKDWPNDPFFHELKGQILFESGRVEDALTSYLKANQLLPKSPIILTELAKVELAQKPERLQSAVGHLQKANSIDNSNPYAWRLLATAYGKAGNMGQSHLALAEEALLYNKPDDGFTQASRALGLLKQGSPAHQRAQDVKTQAVEMKRIKKEMESTF